MSKFELISKYEGQKDLLPRRATDGSVGYDFFVAEDIIVPSIIKLRDHMFYGFLPDEHPDTTRNFPGVIEFPVGLALNLSTMADITKKTNTRPTLVPTGIKCKLDEKTYLQLSVRSSTPLKHWLILANGIGIIDRDYYNNEDNEGHIMFQIINLAPFDIQLNKGDRIGQGIILPYLVTDDDIAMEERYNKRCGGFGSTT